MSQLDEAIKVAEWARYLTVTAPVYGSSKVDAANAIIKELRALAAQQPVVPSRAVEHVAWLRYVTHSVEFDGTENITIEVCDSDAKGAFKVYCATPLPAEQPAVPSPSFWVIEKFENGKSAGYWNGLNSRSPLTAPAQPLSGERREKIQRNAPVLRKSRWDKYVGKGGHDAE